MAALMIGAMVFLAACSSGGGGGDGGGGTQPAATTTSTLVDMAVANLRYSTSSNPGTSLFTGSGGEFQCVAGETVTFYYGPTNNFIIGNPLPCPSSPSTVTTVFLLGASSVTDPSVNNLAQLLMTLDSKTNPNALTIPNPLPPGYTPANVPPFNTANTTTFNTGLTTAFAAGTTITTPAQATAQLTASLKTLTVTIVNNGTVTSNPTGINCTGTCSFVFQTGASVTLTEVGNGFTGWGGGCSGTGNCSVTMSADTPVTATFAAAPPPATLTILQNGGGGTGTVGCSTTGGAPFSSCGTYQVGTVVTVQATATGSSTFTNWSDGTGSAGICSTTNPCVVTLNADSTLRANFAPPAAQFSVTVNTLSNNGGAGTVQCTANNGVAALCGSYPVGTQISIIPSSNNANFTGWTNGNGSGLTANCGGAIGPCNFQLTSSTNITANFNRPTLTVIVSGTGSVSSNPTGITNCTTNCSVAFNKGTSVTLTAGSGLTGWSGGGCSGTGNCQVTLNNDTTVTANFTPPPPSVAGVFTYHNDNLRTGQNLNETTLTWANVNQGQFGKKFSYQLDGIAYASPLYVAGVSIPGQGVHNVVYVATEHDSVYALDADGLNPFPNPLWQVSLIPQGETTVPAADTGECCDIAPEIGISGTPVIEPNTGTLYVVAKTKVTSTAAYVQRVHALDIATGNEKFGGPVVIQASVPGTGDGNDGNGNIPFDPLIENQHAGLLLNNGVVYISFASHGDNGPYHGWVLGYDATNLQQVMAYNDTPNGSEGGIWQGTAGLAADSAGSIYFVTGNGTFDANTSGGADYGDSVEKISPNGSVLDYFTPHDQATLSAADLDLGSGDALLLPDQSGAHPHLLVTAGKGGTIYLIDRDNMGQFNPNNDNQIVQSLVGIFPNPNQFVTGGNFSAAVYFNGTVYFSPVGGTIQAFQLSNGLLSIAPTSQSAANFAFPGGALAISANGSTNGILWAVERTGSGTAGVLHAYKATDLSSELYNSNQAAGSRDTLDIAAKFTIPLVANGKVYVASVSQLTVYGLLP